MKILIVLILTVPQSTDDNLGVIVGVVVGLGVLLFVIVIIVLVVVLVLRKMTSKISVDSKDLEKTWNEWSIVRTIRQKVINNKFVTFKNCTVVLYLIIIAFCIFTS